MTGFAIAPRLVRIPAPGGSVLFPNPLGVASLGPVWSGLLLGTLTALSLASLPLLAIVVAALVTRFRRGDPDVRQQVKWLAFALAVMLAAQLLGPLRDTATGGPASGPLVIASDAVSAAVPLAVVPAVITLAILKYRLYEIDVIINRAVAYGLLSAALTAVYAAHRAGHRDAGRARRRPAADRRGGRRGRRAVPARAAAGPAGRQPPGLRASGPRPTRCCPTSPRTWPASWTTTEAVRPDGAVSPARRAPTGPRSGSASATELRPLATWPRGSARRPPVPLADGRAAGLRGGVRAVAVRHGNELLGALALRQAAGTSR